MIVMAVRSKLITRRVPTEGDISRWQGLLEIVVYDDRKTSAAGKVPAACSSRRPAFEPLSGYQPPTGSPSTTAALALCVFIAVPLFAGIGEQGLGGYLKTYTRPTIIMLPFNVSELSRTLALAVRLFGKHGVMIIGILLTITVIRS